MNNGSGADSASAAIQITEAACQNYYVPGIGVPAAPNFDDLKLLYGLGPPIAREHLSPSMCTRAAMRMRERLQREIKIRELRDQINELRRLRGALIEGEDEQEKAQSVATVTKSTEQANNNRNHGLEPGLQLDVQQPIEEIVMSPINHSSPLNQSSPLPLPHDTNQATMHSAFINAAALSMMSSPPGTSQASVITNVSSSSRTSSPMHGLGVIGHQTSHGTHNIDIARAAAAETAKSAKSAKSTETSKLGCSNSSNKMMHNIIIPMNKDILTKFRPGLQLLEGHTADLIRLPPYQHLCRYTLRHLQSHEVVVSRLSFRLHQLHVFQLMPLHLEFLGAVVSHL